ncbi:hypothetical protein GPECTOR_18g173 [Gonium pectorale]|uniref:S1 motif domain-containing protein n=1 Tax=Gonium pectorale TaxID=33097 RepID=A0A150GKZ9_GONPE|nr:hypothetical protein GPECTOR_18g173 [Gonium pectorale]|eukprot:KXZ50020.1 hypothetical protein GPECTOR_18g173 [Gonium pectorale]
MIDYDEFGDEEYADMYEEMEAMLEATDYTLSVGDRVWGTVVDVDDEGAYVEIGAKALAFCPLTECGFARLKTPLEAVRPGMQREFLVVEDERRYGQAIVSLAALEAATFWARMRQLQDEDVAVNVRVESVNRGGMLVRFGPLDGFVPVSHFGSSITPDTMASLVGSELRVKFLQVEEDTERLVFSHKRVSSAGGTGSESPRSLRVGDLVTGVVQTVKPYGAFVDLGAGVTGLLHVSQVSADRVLMLDRVLAEGDQVKVLVLSVDQERNRVTLTTKKLEPTPGDMLRDPKMVFEQAEQMAAVFRQRIDAAAATANAEHSAEAAAADGQGPYVY